VVLVDHVDIASAVELRTEICLLIAVSVRGSSHMMNGLPFLVNYVTKVAFQVVHTLR